MTVALYDQTPVKAPSLTSAAGSLVVVFCRIGFKSSIVSQGAFVFGDIRASDASGRRVKRAVTLATRSLTLPAGQSETVQLKLNTTGLRLLNSRRSLRARLTTMQELGTTSTVVSSQIVSFKRSKKKR